MVRLFLCVFVFITGLAKGCEVTTWTSDHTVDRIAHRFVLTVPETVKLGKLATFNWDENIEEIQFGQSDHFQASWDKQGGNNMDINLVKGVCCLIDREGKTGFAVSAWVKCKSGNKRNIVLKVKLQDMNTQKPTFVQEYFTIKVPTPFPAGKSLGRLSLYDMDFTTSTNGNVTVHDTDDFRFKVTHTGNKNYSLEIIPEKELAYDKDGMKVVVTTHDMGTPQLTGSTTVHIRLYPMELFKPTFDQVVYQAYAHGTSNVTPLVLKPKAIMATYLDSTSSITYGLNNADYAEHFYVKKNLKTGEAELYLVKEIVSPRAASVIILIRATHPSSQDTSEVPVVIRFPKLQQCPTCPPCPTEMPTCPTPAPCPTPGEPTCPSCPPPTCPTPMQPTCPTCPTSEPCTMPTIPSCPTPECPSCPPVSCPTTPFWPTCTPCPEPSTSAPPCPPSQQCSNTTTTTTTTTTTSTPCP